MEFQKTKCQINANWTWQSVPVLSWFLFTTFAKIACWVTTSQCFLIALTTLKQQTIIITITIVLTIITIIIITIISAQVFEVKNQCTRERRRNDETDGMQEVKRVCLPLTTDGTASYKLIIVLIKRNNYSLSILTETC